MTAAGVTLPAQHPPGQDARPRIDAIHAFHPARSVDIGEIADDIGLKPAQVKLLRRVHGMRRLHWDPRMSLLELLLPAAQRSLAATGDPATVRYVIYAHATQEVTPSTLDAASMLRDSLHLPSAESFAITQQNCASGLAALDAAGMLLAADGVPGARALVVTGEKAFSKLNHVYYSLGSVMGEAASATLVSLDGPGDVVRSYVVETHGEFNAGILMTPEEHHQHSAIGDRTIVNVIHRALQHAGARLEDIDIVVQHNPDMSTVADLLGFPRERLFSQNLAQHSHCYASDVFVNYVQLGEAGRLTPGRNYLFVSTGLGATYSAMVVRHTGGTACGTAQQGNATEENEGDR